MNQSPPVLPCLLATSIAAFAGSSALAQEAAPLLEEIIVTAQKRVQNAQDVPIAISTLSEQFINDTGIDNITQAIPLLPGVTGTTYGITTNSWGVRGITTNDWAIGSEPSVAIYIDEAYVGRNHLATTSFFDIGSLEVLKGPQGTLFGRNASAGAISLTTNRPELENSFQLGFGFGNEGQQQYDLIGNVALSDNFAIRVAAHGTRFEGLWTDVQNNEDMFRDEDAVRVSAYWEATESFSATLSLNYGEQESNGNVTYNPQLSTVSFGEEFPDQVAWDIRNREQNETQGANLRLNWELSDSLSFTSITDVREADYYYLGDTDGANNGPAIDGLIAFLTDLSLQEIGFPPGTLTSVTGGLSLHFEQEGTTVDTFGQEFRFSGGSEKFEWFAGVTYFTEELEENQNAPAINTANPGVLGFPFVLEPVEVPPGLELFRDRNELRGDYESYGIYLDGTWSVTDELRISVSCPRAF